jgi:nucleotide-binding universal stress UspA family protein
MYDRILFPTDGSEAADDALPYALAIARHHDATLHVLHVADTNQDSLTLLGDEVIDVLEREGERIVEAAATRVREAGVAADTRVAQGDPALTIADYAETADTDLIVMATHGRSGLDRVLLGSVTEGVAESATVPVVTLDATADWDPVYPPGDLLVATDGSPGGDRAVAAGTELAAATGATLHLLAVVERGFLSFDDDSPEGPAADRARETLDEARETAAAAGVEALEATVGYGRPYRTIHSYLEDRDVDLLVVGAHGRTEFRRDVLGGVSSKLLRAAPTPVMVVRVPGDPESESSHE